MKPKNWHYWLLIAISVITILSGLLQLVLTDLVLTVISAKATPTSLHFFAIIGMFMVLFGSALLHALLNPDPQPVVILWAGLQKFGASVAVGLGVMKLIFSPFAFLVAGFDLLSGVLVTWYWLRIRKLPQGQNHNQLVSQTAEYSSYERQIIDT